MHKVCTCKLAYSVCVSQYVQNNKEADCDWFRLESNKDGTRWFGKCWYIHDLLKYEFDVEFDVSIIVCYLGKTNCKWIIKYCKYIWRTDSEMAFPQQA